MSSLRGDGFKPPGRYIGDTGLAELTISKEEVLHNLRKHCNLPEPVPSFDDFQAERLDQLQAKEHVMAWCNDETAPPWLFLYGPPGTGKTHLAFAAIDTLVSSCRHARYENVPELLDILRREYAAEERRDEFLDYIFEIDWLALDDLGANRATGWSDEAIYKILNHRYMYSKRTLITTNVGQEQLDPRIVSRLLDRRKGVQIAMDWEDYRRTAR